MTLMEPVSHQERAQPPAALDDEPRLIERLRQGDEQAFDALYAHYRPRVFCFLARLAGRRDVAEDLLQETWLRLARAAPALRPDTRLGPWLFTVARNLVVSHWRRQRPTVTSEGQGEDGAWVSPFDLVAASQTERRLEQALAGLPPAMREVLLLVAVEHLEPSEAAQVLGVSPEAVRQRLSRGRAMMAEALAR